MILDALFFGIVVLAALCILWAAADAIRLVESLITRAKRRLS